MEITKESLLESLENLRTCFERMEEMMVDFLEMWEDGDESEKAILTLGEISEMTRKEAVVIFKGFGLDSDLDLDALETEEIREILANHLGLNKQSSQKSQIQNFIKINI